MRVLGIESSCDDTAAAVYDSVEGLLSNVVSSQVPVHSLYGGVVPELASREHIRSVVPVVERALADAGSRREEIDGVAVTTGPGLIGSLLVGLCFAKSLAYAWKKPIYGADHLESHIFAIFLEQDLEFPYVALLVSGGHTSLFRVSGWEDVSLLGRTLDDAAGEAFDKAAKLMGLGYPGGAAIDKLAQKGNAGRRTFLSTPSGKAAGVEDVAASFQEAVVDVLVGKTLSSAKRSGIPRVVLSGGVSANSRLRAKVTEEANRAGVRAYLPSRALCTDNAAMVAFLGERRLSAGRVSGPELNAYAATRFSR
jgi:N6-L-threonylcarbamoyladenine synthase